MTGFTDGSSVHSYAYDGMGNRYQQTVDGSTTTYVLDLNGGLSQVLDDGSSRYLYGAAGDLRGGAGVAGGAGQPRR